MPPPASAVPAHPEPRAYRTVEERRAALRLAIRALKAQRQTVAFEGNLFKKIADPLLARAANAYAEYTAAIETLQALLHDQH